MLASLLLILSRLGGSAGGGGGIVGSTGAGGTVGASARCLLDELNAGVLSVLEPIRRPLTTFSSDRLN